MRQCVLQARNAEEVDTVPIAADLNIRPATSSGTPSNSMRRRATFTGVAALGSEVMQNSVAPWVANGLCTPKNSDRRDLTGSVEQMMPLWRGSASEMLQVAARPHATLVSSPTHCAQMQPMASSPPQMQTTLVSSPTCCVQTCYPRPDLPSSPTHTSRVQASVQDCGYVAAPAQLFLGTPKNAGRPQMLLSLEASIDEDSPMALPQTEQVFQKDAL